MHAYFITMVDAVSWIKRESPQLITSRYVVTKITPIKIKVN